MTPRGPEKWTAKAAEPWPQGPGFAPAGDAATTRTGTRPCAPRNRAAAGKGAP